VILQKFTPRVVRPENALDRLGHPQAGRRDQQGREPAVIFAQARGLFQRLSATPPSRVGQHDLLLES
jgi:hypothetical protein